MADTYTDELRIRLQEDGANSTTWGQIVNTNLQLLEDAISGMVSIATTGGTTALTTASGSTDEARMAILKITGALVSNATITVPAKTKKYLVWNATSGSFTLTIKTVAGNGVTVLQEANREVYCDGTDVLATGPTTSAQLAASMADETGSGALVFATSPTLVTPTLGVATATSVNGVSMTLMDTSGGAGGGTASNLIIGRTSLPSATINSYGNVAIGVTAMTAVTSGYGNTCVGHNAAPAITSGNNNICVGANVGVFGPTTGNTNIIIGAPSYTPAGNSNNVIISGVAGGTLGSNGVMVGRGAGGFDTSTNEGNVCIGYSAGAFATGGSHNTVVGENAQADGVTGLSGENNTVIGYLAKTATQSSSNTVTLGNSSISTLRCQVTSITSLSDARDKTDVVPLTTGLSTVMRLNPVRFTWNMRDGGKVGIKDAGFIAQDLQTVDDDWLRLVYAENPEKLEASYGRLIPVLVKAIQELKQEVDDLRAQLLG